MSSLSQVLDDFINQIKDVHEKELNSSADNKNVQKLEKQLKKLEKHNMELMDKLSKYENQGNDNEDNQINNKEEIGLFLLSL